MSTGSWIVVCAAVLVTGAVAGVLLTRPVWSSRPERRFVPAMLSLHAGLALTTGLVATAALSRSWQLFGKPATGTVPLLDVSRIDGDKEMYALLVLAAAFTTLLAVLALALGARFAAGDDPTERIVACGVLGLEICLSGYAAAQVLGGSRSVAALVATAHLPLVMVAMVVCWPPVEPEPIGAAR